MDATSPFPPDCAATYRAERQLGEGAFGAVFLALQTTLGRRVVIKLIAPGLAGDEDLRRRFVAEARLTATVAHPNVVVVVDFGCVPGSPPWIAYEYVPGKDLRAALARGPLEPARALDAAAQVCAALAAAHARGIVHRDVKPENVLVAEDGVVKLADFGIARPAAQGATRTATGTLLGTPHYMAPELIKGARASAQTDLYAAGCLTFELLTGRPPFPVHGVAAILQAHLEAAPTPPSALRPGLPPAVDHAVLAALAKAPELRPRDADDLRERLLQARAALGEAAPAAAPRRPAPASPTLRTDPAARGDTRRAAAVARPRPELPRRLLPAAALALLGLGAGLLAWWAGTAATRPWSAAEVDALVRAYAETGGGPAYAAAAAVVADASGHTTDAADFAHEALDPATGPAATLGLEVLRRLATRAASDDRPALALARLALRRTPPDVEEAQSCLLAAVRRHPGARRARLWAAELVGELGAVGLAMEVLRPIGPDDPRHPEAVAVRLALMASQTRAPWVLPADADGPALAAAQRALAEGRPDEACRLLDACPARHPTVVLRRAQALLARGARGEAVALLRAAVASPAPHWRLRTELACLVSDFLLEPFAPLSPEAEALLAQAIEGSDHPGPRFLRALALERAGRLDEATEAYDAAALTGREPRPLFERVPGALHRLANRKGGDGAVWIRVRLARSYQHNGRPALALAILDRIPDDAGAYPTSLVVRGQALEALGRFDEAEPALREGCRLCAGLFWSYAPLADFLARRGRKLEAADVLDEGIRTAADPWRLRPALADLLMELGQLDRAEAALAGIPTTATADVEAAKACRVRISQARASTRPATGP